MFNGYRALVTFVFLLAIGAAATMTEDFKAQVGRHPSSILGKKEMILGEVRNPLMKHTDKIHGPIQVAVEMDGRKPEKPADVFVVRGTVTSDENLDNVDFKWAIPEGVDVLNGEVHGQFAQVTSGKPVTLHLTLQTRTGENHQIHLVAGASARGSRFSETAQYNTLTQDLLNASREELRKSTEARVRKDDLPRANESHAHDQSELKVFH